MDPRAPRAEAFAVSGGRFVAVGSTSDIRNLAGKNTQTFDAKGMTVVPGFIDCHNHAGGETLLNEVLVGNPFEVEFVSIRSVIGKLRERAQKTPPGTWVEGYFFDDTKVSDKRALTIRDLDEVSSEHPVIVRHRGGHTYFYNSKAFAMAGITQGHAQPDGRHLRQGCERQPHRPRHRPRVGAVQQGRHAADLHARAAEQRARDGVAHISKEFARYGLTSVHHEGGDLPAMQDVRARGDLKHRISYEASGRSLEAMIAAGMQSGFGDDWIKFGATSEHTVDGSFSERTMALSTPYPNVTPPYKGNVTETQETLNAWVERVHRAGIQVNCHANGDVAIDMYLTAMERALKLLPRANARPKITHCTHAQPVADRADEGDRRGAGAVHHLRVLQPGQVRVLRRRVHEERDGVPLAARCGHLRLRRIRLLARPVRAADGHPGHGHAQGLGRQGVGRQPADQRERGDRRQHLQRRVGVRRRGDQGIDHRRQARRLRRARRRPAHGDAEKIKDIQIVRTVVGGTISYQA